MIFQSSIKHRSDVQKNLRGKLHFEIVQSQHLNTDGSSFHVAYSDTNIYFKKRYRTMIKYQFH